MNNKIMISLVVFSLLLCSCSQHKGIVLIQEGKPPCQIDNDVSLLPVGVTEFTLNSGDVLRLGASGQLAQKKKFLLERGHQVQISFHYTGENYLLMPGDAILVSFLADSNLNYELNLRLDGRISMPKIGEINAAGLTPATLGQMIQEKFRGKLNDPRVTVSVLRSNMKSINSMAGTYMVLPDGTIHLPVIGTFAAAGNSLDELEKKISIKVQKKFKNSFNASVVTRNNETRQLEIYDRVVTVTPSGDIILPEIGSIMVRGLTMTEMKNKIQDALEKNYSNKIDVSITLISGGNHSVYISGDVLYPGVYPLAPSMTMLKAVMLAGGVTRTGDLRDAVLIHYTKEGNLNIFKTNLDEVISEGKKIQDLKLGPQDIVFIPRTGIADANLFIEQYITRMLPFNRSINYNYNKNPDLNP